MLRQVGGQITCQKSLEDCNVATALLYLAGQRSDWRYSDQQSAEKLLLKPQDADYIKDDIHRYSFWQSQEGELDDGILLRPLLKVMQRLEAFRHALVGSQISEFEIEGLLKYSRLGPEKLWVAFR